MNWFVEDKQIEYNELNKLLVSSETFSEMFANYHNENQFNIHVNMHENQNNIYNLIMRTLNKYRYYPYYSRFIYSGIVSFFIYTYLYYIQNSVYRHISSNTIYNNMSYNGMAYDGIEYDSIGFEGVGYDDF